VISNRAAQALDVAGLQEAFFPQFIDYLTGLYHPNDSSFGVSANTMNRQTSLAKMIHKAKFPTSMFPRRSLWFADRKSEMTKVQCWDRGASADLKLTQFKVQELYQFSMQWSV
jgi:hypothetical protein